MYLPNVEAHFDNRNFARIGEILKERFPIDPAALQAPSILEALSANLAISHESHFSAVDAAYIDRMNELSRSIHCQTVDKNTLSANEIGEIPQRWDFIGQNDRLDNCAMQVFNFLSQSRVHQSKKVLLLSSFRNDGPYLIDWISHHRAIGFTDICIFSNDNIDGSEALFEALHLHKIITYVKNVVGTHCHPQRKVFGCAVEMLSLTQSFEWVAFIDSDELVTISSDHNFNILSMLDTVDRVYVDEKPTAICLNWKWFAGNEFQYKDEPMWSRFSSPSNSPHCKSLVRMRNVASMFHLHIPSPKRWGFFVDASLQRHKPYELTKVSAPNYLGGQVNHYWNKSYEEFLVKKMRGDALIGKSNLEYRRSTEQYFLFNSKGQNLPTETQPIVFSSRVDRERAQLLSLPGIAECHSNCVRAFKRIVEKISNSENSLAEFRRLQGLLGFANFSD